MDKATTPPRATAAGTSLLFTPEQVSELENTSKILHLLHHRNSNQHRRQPWYKSFSIFRRHLNHLIHDLTITHTPTALPTTMLPSRKREIVRMCNEKCEKRLKVWREGYVRKWFGAFSQLVADNQFAVIGLVLLGCLGRVCAVTGASEALIEEGTEEDIGIALKGFAEGMEVDGLMKGLDERGMDDDVGIVIARDAGGDGGKAVRRYEEDLPLEPGEDISAVYEEELITVQPPKVEAKKRKSQDALSISAVGISNPKKAKKKKLKKKDAMDELFSSLF